MYPYAPLNFYGLRSNEYRKTDFIYYHQTESVSVFKGRLSGVKPGSLSGSEIVQLAGYLHDIRIYYFWNTP